MPASHHNHTEASERTPALALSPALTWSPKYPEKFAAFPERWKSLIAHCKEMQQALGNPSDGTFCGHAFTPSSWNQLVNGAYRIPTSTKGISSIEDELAGLAQHAKQALLKKADPSVVKLTLAERFISRPEYHEVLDCLEDAETNAAEGLEERAVILVGGTRCGKSALVAKLIADRKVNWHLRATSIMKRSFRQFLLSIGAALKLRDIEGNSLAELERSIFNKLEKARGVLAIEELQSFSPSALEFLKSLLNDTQVSLVICMLPGQFARMIRSTGEDMQQFLGRSVGVVKLEVTQELVASFSPRLWQRCPNAAELQKLIATEAALGGGMSLLRDVCRDALLLAQHDGLKTHHVTRALEDFRRKIPQMKRAA